MISQIFNFSNYSFNPYSIPGMVSSVLLLLFGIYVLLQNRKYMANISFFITTLSASIWLSGISIIYLTKNIELAIFYYKYYTFLGVAFISPSVYMITVSVLDLFKRKKKFIWMNYIIAFIFYIFAFKTDWLVIGVKKYFWGNYIQYGFLAYPFLFFFFILMTVSFYYYATQLRKIEEGTKKEQIRLLFIALLIAYIGTIDYVACFGIEVYPFGYIPILFFISIQGYAIITYQKINVGEILNSIQDGIIAINADGKVAIINNSAERIIGIKTPDVLNRKLAEIFSFSTHKLEYPERFMKLINRIESAPGEIINKEISYSNPIRYINITTMPVRDRFGAISGNILLLSDITERKHAENTIRESEKRFKQLAESAGEWIWEVDVDGLYTYSSPVVEKILGFKSKEIVGKKHFFDLFAPDVRKDLKKRAFEAFARKESFKNFVNPNVHKNGSLVILETSAIPIIDDKGNFLGYRGTDIDITERQRMLETTKKSEERFRDLFENANDAIWTADLKGRYMTVNNLFEKLFGFKKGELIGKKSIYLVAPESRKESIENYKKTLAGESAEYELVVLNKKGERRIHLERLRPLREKDRIIGVQGIGRDITEQKRAEEALQRSQEEFINLFNSNPLAAIYHDEEGNILNINSRFTELFGYSSQDIIGKNINKGMIFIDNRMIEESKRLTKEALKRGLTNYETIRKKKDGTIVPVLISTSKVIIEGKPKAVIALYRDITEQKRNEQLQKVVYNISKAVNSPISLNQLYPVIHQELSTIVDTTNFYIALVDEKEDKIFFPYNIDNTKPIHLPRTINHNSLVAEVIRTGKPIFVNQEMIQEEKTLMEFKEWFGTLRKVWLGAPLKVEDKTIGAIVVQSYTSSDLYSEKDIGLLEFVSSQVATAIERKRTEEKIRYLSFHDALTDLYNRAYFEEELKRMNNLRYYPLSIISLDVNGLKVINDTFGHDQGDKLLQHLASLLTSISRKGDIIARVGGDEFAILLPSTSSQATLDFCERIRKVCLEDDIEPAYLRVSLALGHVTQKGEYKNIKILLKEVDQKMYQDKLFSAKSREKHLLDSFQLILAERDPHTEDHSRRLQELALSLGKKVGLTEYQLNNLRLLALLHDIGKIGISDSILFKASSLTPSEWKKMKEYPKIGYRMAKQIPDFAPIAREILCHHEHWDGSGYPEGLKKEEIPILSRIIAIVDAYDVMQSRRPYKEAVTKTEALKEIKKCAGTQFDPQLVKIFLKIVKT